MSDCGFGGIKTCVISWRKIINILAYATTDTGRLNCTLGVFETQLLSFTRIKQKKSSVIKGWLLV